MANDSGYPIPAARRDRLVVKELADEVLVYDLERHRAHCLNPTAAAVWRHCDGQTTVAALAQRLRQELPTPVEEEVVWLAVEQLDKARLLSEGLPRPGDRGGMSRREVMRLLGAAAVMAVPLVTTIVAPPSSAAVSCVGVGGACTSTSQCCPGLFCHPHGVCQEF